MTYIDVVIALFDIEDLKYFVQEYGDFIREGVLGLSNDKLDQEELMKLMLFQSSKLADGEFCNLERLAVQLGC